MSRIQAGKLLTISLIFLPFLFIFWTDNQNRIQSRCETNRSKPRHCCLDKATCAEDILSTGADVFHNLYNTLEGKLAQWAGVMSLLLFCSLSGAPWSLFLTSPSCLHGKLALTVPTWPHLLHVFFFFGNEGLGVAPSRTRRDECVWVCKYCMLFMFFCPRPSILGRSLCFGASPLPLLD